MGGWVSIMQEAPEWRTKASVAEAEAYTKRKKRKHAAEMRLIGKALAPLANVGSFLDAPCGVGRATILLEKHGYKTTGVDLGDGAIEVARREIARHGLNSDIEKANLEHLPFQDKSFDAVLCFRFFHHLPTPEIRERIVAELCRVASRYVLISYFSPFSVTSIKRSLRQRLGGKPSHQFRTPLQEVRHYFTPHGFRLLRDYPQRRFIHTLHLAVFERKQA